MGVSRIARGADTKSNVGATRESIGRFFDHTYAGSRKASLIEEFEKLLPEKEPWKSRS